VAGRDRLVGLDDLLQLADDVVDVLELAVLDVKGVAAEARPLREEDAAGVGRLHVEFGRDVAALGAAR
jgi:hypothetical protein